MAAVSRSGSPAVRRTRSLSWRDRILDYRDAIIANTDFQRFAATFPLFRPVARRRASALFELCAGFVYSQILLASVRLRLFEHLAEGALAPAELAPRTGLSVEAAELLLDAAAALKLVQRRSRGRYGLGPMGAALVGNPGVIAMVEHHAMLYGDLQDPVALLRGQTHSGQLARYWPYAAGDAPAGLTRDEVAPYTALMSASQPMIAQQVVDSYPFRRHRCLLDIGGGDGAFFSVVAQRAPKLRCVLFDLPAVAD